MAGDLPIQKQSKMEKKQKNEKSLEYFYRRTRNNVINSDYQIESLEYAIKLYEEEIEKAYNKGWLEGVKHSVSLNKTK
jgi:hypothetical protein